MQKNKNKFKLECGPMPNVMVALPNISGTSVQRHKVWRPLLVPCSNAAKMRNPLKFAGVPQTTGPISAASGPKFAILCEHVEEVLLLQKFLSNCRYVPQLRRYSRTKLCDGAHRAIFCVLYFQRAAFSTFQTCILN